MQQLQALISSTYTNSKSAVQDAFVECPSATVEQREFLGICLQEGLLIKNAPGLDLELEKESPCDRAQAVGLVERFGKKAKPLEQSTMDAIDIIFFRKCESCTVPSKELTERIATKIGKKPGLESILQNSMDKPSILIHPLFGGEDGRDKEKQRMPLPDRVGRGQIRELIRTLLVSHKKGPYPVTSTFAAVHKTMAALQKEEAERSDPDTLQNTSAEFLPGYLANIAIPKADLYVAITKDTKNFPPNHPIHESTMYLDWKQQNVERNARIEAYQVEMDAWKQKKDGSAAPIRPADINGKAVVWQDVFEGLRDLIPLVPPPARYSSRPSANSISRADPADNEKDVDNVLPIPVDVDEEKAGEGDASKQWVDPASSQSTPAERDGNKGKLSFVDKVRDKISAFRSPKSEDLGAASARFVVGSVSSSVTTASAPAPSATVATSAAATAAAAPSEEDKAKLAEMQAELDLLHQFVQSIVADIEHVLSTTSQQVGDLLHKYLDIYGHRVGATKDMLKHSTSVASVVALHISEFLAAIRATTINTSTQITARLSGQSSAAPPAQIDASATARFAPRFQMHRGTPQSSVNATARMVSAYEEPVQASNTIVVNDEPVESRLSDLAQPVRAEPRTSTTVGSPFATAARATAIRTPANYVRAI